MTSSITAIVALLLLFAGSAAVATGETRDADPKRGTSLPADLADRVAIRNLIDRLSDAINHEEWSALDGLLTQDAVWEALPPVSWRLNGLSGIKEGLTRNSVNVEPLLYVLTGLAIRLDGPERAAVRSTLNEILLIKTTGGALQIVGSYDDTLVKQNGEWKMARRTFRLKYTAPANPPNDPADGSKLPARPK